MRLTICLSVCASLLAFFAVPLTAAAAQGALVEDAAIEAHQKPSTDSPVVGKIEKGMRIPVSSRFIKGQAGVLWYKTILPSGAFGFIRANDIITDEQRATARAYGIDLVNR